MSTEDRKRILERIRACLALGDKERNPSENEAATAIAMAKKLMAQYNLSMADVAFSEANVGAIREESLRARAGIPKWEIDVGRVCNNLFGTKYFLRPVVERSKYATHRNGEPKLTEKTIIVFYGYDTDVALAVEVYKLLKLEILGMARRWEIKEAQDKPYLTPGQIRGRRFAYCDGIVWSLINRSNQEAAQRNAADAAKVRDLVIRKDEGLKEWAKKTHPDLHPVRRRETGAHEDAQFDGTNDGRKISLEFKNTIRTSSDKPLSISHKTKGE